MQLPAVLFGQLCFVQGFKGAMTKQTASDMTRTPLLTMMMIIIMML